MAGDGVLIRALYRASLRGIRGLHEPLPIQRLINPNDWGKFQRLSQQTLEADRIAVFHWANAKDVNDVGALEPHALENLVRRRYRDVPSDVDEALNEGFAALRGFYDLVAHLEVGSVAVTRGIRVQATSRFLGVNNDNKNRVRLSVGVGRSVGRENNFFYSKKKKKII